MVKKPFQEIADGMGTDGMAVLSVIRQMLHSGIIRKFAAILRHQRAGFNRNAMVVWAAPPARRDQAGQVLASFREVTHCYERTPPFQGRYSLFTMVHFKHKDEKQRLEEMAKAAGISDYMMLFSEHEFKKSSMRYF